MDLGGIGNFNQLAAVIAERKFAGNLSARTLRDLNADATKTQKAAVADACGLPYEFFTVDFQRLPEIANGGQPVEALTLQERVAELERLVGRLVAEASGPSSSGPSEDLPAQEGPLR